MQVEVNSEGSVTVLKPMGPIILGELEELDNSLSNLSRNWTKRIIINMDNVTFIDSAGLELIDKFRLELDTRGLKLKLGGLNEMSQKIFELTRLSKHFEIFPDTTSAVRSFL